MRSIRVTRLRALLATAVVVLSAAALFGVAPHPEHVAQRGATGAASAARVESHAPALLTRSTLTTALFEGARPARTRSIALDALLAAAALAFASVSYARRAAGAQQHRRHAVDAVFAPRRGPPQLAVTH